MEIAISRPSHLQTAVHVLVLLALLGSASADTDAQVSLLVRGTITALEGNLLSVKTREGKDLQLRLSDHLVVVAAKATKVEDLTPVVTDTPADRSALKPGEYIFTSAAVAVDGTMTVERIHVSRDGVKPPQ